MKIYVKSSEFIFPETIEIEMYPGKWITYYKHYEHEDGGCYYKSDDRNDTLTGSFVSLYPDGHLTYLWEGIERPWNTNWR